MTTVTPLVRRLGAQGPVILAPMAGASTPSLVAAVGEAGGFGFIPAAYLSADKITAFANAVRALTARPFGINIFAPTAPTVAGPFARAAVARMAPYHSELGIPAPAMPAAPGDLSNDDISAVLESGATVLSFTFGIPPRDVLQAARSRGMMLVGTATSVAEGVLLEQAGVDAIVAQGSEAGAHRGTFAVEFAEGMVGTLALVPQMVDAVRVPVIASGGIMDGRGVAAALALGAEAAQMGTAFLTCDEAGIPDVHKQVILTTSEHRTQITRAFSGRPARGIINRFMTETEAAGPDAILPFPLQNALTRPMRAAAAEQGNADCLSLWAGQGVRLARRQTAGEAVLRVHRETEQVLGCLGGLARS